MKKDALIIVTGGNGYIGNTIVKKLREAGAVPVIFDIHSEDGFTVDITDYAQVEAAVKKTVEKYGRVDGLVNCAGGSARSEAKPFAEQSMEVIRHILEINLLGTFHLVRAVIPFMYAQNSGSIVNISSAVALGGIKKFSDYGAAKGGIIAATKSWAMEFGGHNVRVNCVCPGKVQRPDAMPEDPAAFARRYSFLNRLCTANDVAEMVLFLLDDEKSGFITGQNYVVDGGRSLGLKGDNIK